MGWYDLILMDVLWDRERKLKWKGLAQPPSRHIEQDQLPMSLPPLFVSFPKFTKMPKKPIIQVDRFRFMESQLYIHDLHMKEGDGLRAVAPTPPAALSVFSQVDWMKGEGVYN
mmetsp:Transcript_17047/g.26603  ORF Transcript_17047/g.26603 Transcript_17047/m.26603 type:complete len:113 (-) Transcript_17047:144-482(-)